MPSACPYREISLYRDAQKQLGTVLAHAHSIVNSRVLFIGKTRDLAAWQRVDTDISTVAI